MLFPFQAWFNRMISGTLHAFLSGKIAYAFGFCGPSIVVDTACSSSMVALYQACRGLVNRDCNAAIAGGVNIISSPDVRLSAFEFTNPFTKLFIADLHWP